jgi:hypothetical protein
MNKAMTGPSLILIFSGVEKRAIRHDVWDYEITGSHILSQSVFSPLAPSSERR